MAITSTVYEMQQGTRILWGGDANGITGIHEWTFTDSPTGVHVTTTESFAGAPVEADVSDMQMLLDQSLVAWLEQLKAQPKRAEARRGMFGGLMASDEHGALRRLLDKDEIVDLVHRYSYCVDHRLYDEVAALFTEDCVVDYGPAFARCAVAPRCARCSGTRVVVSRQRATTTRTSS